jgi:hypothetical protein
MPEETQFGRNPEILDATGFSGDGSLLMFGQQVIEARSDTPADPPPDTSIVWVDSTNDRLMIKITDGAGNTRTYTLAPATDYFVEVQRGNITGETMVHKSGRNSAVPNGSFEFVNLLGFTAWPLSAATTVRIKAGGDAADDSGGNGAREVTVQGIDSNFAELNEAITTNGVNASTATTASFWRIYSAWVSSAGVYGAANTAAVTIENSGGGTDLLQIGVEEGQSQFAGWTVPTGKTAYLMSVHVIVDGNKAADVRMFTRANIDDASAAVNSVRLKLYWDGLLGDFRYIPRGPDSVIAAKSDIWFEAQGSGAITEVSVDFELLVIDD